MGKDGWPGTARNDMKEVEVDELDGKKKITFGDNGELVYPHAIGIPEAAAIYSVYILFIL